MRKYLSILLPLFIIGCAPATLPKVDQDMFAAIKADNKQEVERLIAAGANVNVQNDQGDGLTPLGWAAVWGSNKTAELLIARGADVNAGGRNRNTPLHVAAYNGQKETVVLLLGKGANVNAMTKAGWTPLHKALEWLALPYISKEASPSRIAAAGDIMELLIAKGADVNASVQGIMPIHWAAASGQKGFVERLVVKDADVNARSAANYTPLFFAAQADRAAVAEWLIAHGAEVDTSIKSGETPLWIAASDGSADAVKVLLDHGADVRSKNKDGSTPLLATAESLINSYALTSSSPLAGQMRENLGPSRVIEYRKILKEMEVWGGKWREAAMLLVTHGAEININKEEKNPMYAAALVGDKRLVEAMLNKGADINFNPKNAYETPLHGAIGAGHEEVAELLISRGANVNAENKDRQTPMHYLAKYMNSKKLAELMIQHHADVNAKSGRETPLSLAVEAGNKDVAEVLRQHGGN